MKTWSRTAALGTGDQPRSRETWAYHDRDQIIASFEVDVTVSKPLDVLRLKGTSLQEICDYAAFLQKTADDLYAPHRSKRVLATCPCCDADTSTAPDALVVFGVTYKRCQQCGHVFVGTQPTPDALAEVFTESDEHSAVYTDRASLEIRLSQVVQPKLDWVCRIYHRYSKREATSVLDVGAGSGHFVEVTRRAGMRAEGYEISRASRQFARDIFDIELWPQDYLTMMHPPGEFDLITFWGLMEYLPEPKKFLQAAHQQLDPRTGMLVVEVPRFDGISTAIQKEYPETVARHLDPTSHVNCFSDSSLATVLYTCGFKPVAIWYFGMDAYELLVQLMLRLDLPGGLEQLASLIPSLQAAFDSARLCDDIIMAAVPLS